MISNKPAFTLARITSGPNGMATQAASAGMMAMIGPRRNSPLLAAEGLVATVWKEASSFDDVPSVAIAMLDYDESLELGRCVVFHRMESDDGKIVQPYIVDPYPHADSRLHIRVGTVALAGLTPSWYIGVTQMNKAAGK